MIKSRRESWTGYVGCTGKIRNVCKISVEKREERNHSEHLGAEWRIILEWILRKRLRICRLDLSDLKCGPQQALVNTVLNIEVP
jgi:hypothetical protein